MFKDIQSGEPPLTAASLQRPLFSVPNGGRCPGEVQLYFPSVRVKGGMSLRNGMWHSLRNDIIMRNLIYADRFQRNKLN